MAIHEVDPISRIEGHFGAKVDVNGGAVTDCCMHGNLWRGFENFLIGQEPNDAITFTQRICGVCPVPHGMTSTYAIDAVMGYSKGLITFRSDGEGYGVPLTAVLIRNLVLSAEFLMSSITHFYHLAAPSYIQGPSIPPWTPYFAATYYGALTNPMKGAIPGAAPTKAIDSTFPDDVWSAVIKSYVKALKYRRMALEAGALFAGRMPMTSCYVAGGVTNYFKNSADLANKVDLYKKLIQDVGTFIVKEYVPIALTLGALFTPYDNTFNGGSGYGSGCGNFLSWGVFPQANDTLALPGGFFSGGTGGSLQFSAANKAQVSSQFLASGSTNRVSLNLRESIQYSRYGVSNLDASAGMTVTGLAYPGDVFRTKPNRNATSGYTYLKAPRWAGKPAEVGPLARLVVAGIYPINGTALAAHGALAPEYTKYVYTDTGGTGESGLDVRMVDPDVAVGLLRAGLAELRTSLNGGASAITVTSSMVLPGGAASGASTILSAYTYDNSGGVAIRKAYIMGAVRDWIVGLSGGLSTMDRLRARALESLVLVQSMVGAVDKGSGLSLTWTSGGSWIDQLATSGTTSGNWSNKAVPTTTVQNFGGTEAPRGALMHQVTISGGKISKYQCIVPTTWNGSPRTGDAANQKGPTEQAVIGVPFDTATGNFTGQTGGNVSYTLGGVEVMRIVQSFDPCIACAVH